MSTNAAPGADPQAMGNPQFSKYADQATQALTGMLKITYKESPDSPLVNVFTELVKAIGDIENEYEGGMLTGQMAPPMDDSAMEGEMPGMEGPPLEEAVEGEAPMPDMGPMPTEGPQAPFMAAAADTQGMMQAAKKKNQTY